MRTLLTLCVLLLPQDSMDVLVENLGSDRLTVRDEAAQKLTELGEKAVPALTRALTHEDPEVAARVKDLLAVIRIRKQLTPRLMKAMPGLAERLAKGDDRDWTLAFLEATRRDDKQKWIFPTLTREDLEALGRRALKAIRTNEEMMLLAHPILKHRMNGMVPALVDALRRKVSRGFTESILRRLDSKERGPELMKLLGEEDEATRLSAIQLLGRIHYGKAVPTLQSLAKQTRGRVRLQTLRTLVELGQTGMSAEFVPLLKDALPDARREAATHLGRVEYREAIPDLLPLLDDPDKFVRRMAMDALTRLGARKAGPGMVKALKDKDPEIVIAALEGLPRLMGKESVPHLKPFLADERPILRMFAAQGLCLAGSDAGVATILKDNGRLYFLNALRRPDLFRRLNATKVIPLRHGKVGAVMNHYAKPAGLKMDWSGFADADVFRAQEYSGGGPHRIPLLEGLLRFMGLGSRCFVVEDKSIRILPREDALQFWKTWWEKKKK